MYIHVHIIMYVRVTTYIQYVSSRPWYSRWTDIHVHVHVATSLGHTIFLYITLKTWEWLREEATIDGY